MVDIYRSKDGNPDETDAPDKTVEESGTANANVKKTAPKKRRTTVRSTAATRKKKPVRRKTTGRSATAKKTAAPAKRKPATKKVKKAQPAKRKPATKKQTRCKSSATTTKKAAKLDKVIVAENNAKTQKRSLSEALKDVRTHDNTLETPGAKTISLPPTDMGKALREAGSSKGEASNSQLPASSVSLFFAPVE